MFHINSFIFVQLNLNPFYSFTYGAIEKSFFFNKKGLY